MTRLDLCLIQAMRALAAAGFFLIAFEAVAFLAPEFFQ